MKDHAVWTQVFPFMIEFVSVSPQKSSFTILKPIGMFTVVPVGNVLSLPPIFTVKGSVATRCVADTGWARRPHS